ncbi:MAG: FAD:protein FMN transferase [Ferruginibacter sp.]
MQISNDTLFIAPSVFKKVLKLMGNRFEISVVDENAKHADEKIYAAVAEIKRIETLLTTFSETSQTNLINRNAGITPVKVDRELFELLVRCNHISRITQGAFDISYGSADKRFWNFDKDMKSLPDADTAKEQVKLINYRNVILNEKEQTVFLKEAGMRIGFGGIGKGYAAQKAKEVLQQLGVKSGIVNAAGDLTAWGYQPKGEPWTIGIADPSAARKAFSYLNITNTSIATSGNYEKFVMIAGKKYSHTIDPKTGMPVHGIKSVTIIATNPELADAMATPVMIMGVRAGIHMINQIKETGCIIIDEDDNIFTSKNINLQ